MTYLPKKSYSVWLGRYIKSPMNLHSLRWARTKLSTRLTWHYLLVQSLSRTFSFSEFRSFGPQCWPKGTRMSLQSLRDMKRGAPGGANKPRLNCDLACVASVSVRFRSKQRGTRVKDRAKNGVSERAGRGWGREETFPSPSPHFHFFALVSFLARPKSRIPFLCLSLLRNQTETLATQANCALNIVIKGSCEWLRPLLGLSTRPLS